MIDFILIFKAFIIGVVEGITEFLPISSTGHMIIVGKFIDFNGEFANLFEVVIQLGAILAVMFLFRVKILDSFKNLKPKQTGFKLWTNLMVAFLPVGVVGLLFHDLIEEHLMSTLPVSLALVVGGFWMIFAENKYRANDKVLSIDDIDYKQSFFIGCFQCISILWPGFSRAAATIIGGWINGLSSVVAAEFSFFLAIPTMIIASAFMLLKSEITLTISQVFALVVGFVVSFLVAFVVVAKFMKYLQTKPMKVFAVYRIIIGGALLLLGVLGIV